MNKLLNNRGMSVALAAALTVGLAGGAVIGGVAWAQGPDGGFGGMMGGRGMMGPWGWNSPAQGVTATVPFNGFGGMMGAWDQGNRAGNGVIGVIGMDRAVDSARSYVAAYNDPDLILDEIMEFDNGYYVSVKERSTGLGSMELLVDRFTGNVVPEPGPNMMWNTQYGHVGGGMMAGCQGISTPNASAGAMPVTTVQARQNAEAFLNAQMPGVSQLDGADVYHGHYTIDVARDGRISGMLSVNGYSGQVWYHSWHGAFIQEREL